MGSKTRRGRQADTAERPLSRSRALTSDAIEQAAAEIRHLTRVSTLQMALDVGSIVFDRIFHGDAELVHRNGPKDASFGQLAAREDIGISKANLWRCVAMYELSLRLPHVKDSQHLGVSHVRAVLGLPQRSQERLLAKAERERLDVSTLEALATTNRRGQGGRPPKPAVVRAIDSLMRVAALPLDTFSDRRGAAKMSQEDIEAAAEMLRELDDRLRALEALLTKVRPG